MQSLAPPSERHWEAILLRRSFFACVMLTILCGVAHAALAAPTGAKVTVADLRRVKAYLATAHRGRTWDLGPTQVDGEAIRAAYGRSVRFYMVHSNPPLPPGAPLPELLRAHEAAASRHARDKVSLVMSVDGAGRVGPMRKAADFMRGLRRPRTDADRRTVAAAVASLTAGRYAPAGEITAQQVDLVREGEGWIGTGMKERARLVSVELDRRGRVIRVNAGDLVSLPPSAAPGGPGRVRGPGHPDGL